MSRRLAPAVLAAILAAGCGDAPTDLRFVGTLERDRVEVVSEADEPIVAIAVREGDRVEAGQILLRQDDGVAAARAAQAEARVAEARQRLLELERGARVEIIDEARARVAAARAALERDERELRRIDALVERNLLAEASRDEARAARDRSDAALREAQAQLTALLRGNREEEIGRARAALEAAESARRELAITDARLTARAPRAGIVEALPFEVGERPPRGSPVVILLADTAPYARVYVPEPQRVNVRPGLEADVYVDGLAQPVRGVVRFVAAEAVFTPYFALTQRDRSRLAFLAEVRLEGPLAGTLPAGVPVEVRIGGAGE